MPLTVVKALRRFTKKGPSRTLVGWL